MIKKPYFRVTKWLPSEEDCLPHFNFLKGKGFNCWIGFQKRSSSKKPLNYSVWREGIEALQGSRAKTEKFKGDIICAS